MASAIRACSTDSPLLEHGTKMVVTMAGPCQELLCAERCGSICCFFPSEILLFRGSRDAGAHAVGYLSASLPSNAGCVRSARPGDFTSPGACLAPCQEDPFPRPGRLSHLGRRME